MDKDGIKQALKEMLKSGEIKFDTEFFEWGGLVTYIVIDEEKIKIM